jgi:Anti-sigma factor NepR
MVRGTERTVLTALARDFARRFISSGTQDADACVSAGDVLPTLDRDVQAHIGERLRCYYADLLTEPVPPTFAALIDRFTRKERRS